MAEARSAQANDVVKSRLAPSLTEFVRTPMFEFCAVTATALVAIALLAARSTLLTQDNPVFAEPGWDHHAYVAMARDNPFDFHLAPFAWRPLVPLVASLLPFGLQTSFFVVAFLCVTGATVAMYYVGRKAYGGPVTGALAALFFLALGWAAKFALVDFWLPDAAAFLATAAAILCVLHRKPVAFALVLLFGVAAKEAVVFVVPLYYTLSARKLVDWPLLRETALVSAPALLLLLLVRITIPARNEDLGYAAELPANLQQFREFIPSYNYYELLRDIGWHIRLHDRSRETLLLYTTGTWGVAILAFAGIGAVRNPLLAVRLAPFLVLVYSQLLFALNIERLLVLGFPAMVWLALEGANALVHDRPGLASWALLPLGLVLAILNLRHPDTIPISFELQTFVFIAFLAFALGLQPGRRLAATVVAR